MSESVPFAFDRCSGCGLALCILWPEREELVPTEEFDDPGIFRRPTELEAFKRALPHLVDAGIDWTGEGFAERTVRGLGMQLIDNRTGGECWRCRTPRPSNLAGGTA